MPAVGGKPAHRLPRASPATMVAAALATAIAAVIAAAAAQSPPMLRRVDGIRVGVT